MQVLPEIIAVPAEQGQRAGLLLAHVGHLFDHLFNGFLRFLAQSGIGLRLRIVVPLDQRLGGAAQNDHGLEAALGLGDDARRDHPAKAQAHQHDALLIHQRVVLEQLAGGQGILYGLIVDGFRLRVRVGVGAAVIAQGGDAHFAQGVCQILKERGLAHGEVMIIRAEIMHKHAYGNRRFLAGLLGHGQHPFQGIGRLPHRHFGFLIVRLRGHLAAHQHIAAVAERLFFRGHEFDRHDFPIVLFVLMGKIQVQVLLFHDQMQHVCFELVFRFLKAAITAQLHKGARHPFQIRQQGFVGFHGHVATNLKIVIPPQAAHGLAFDIVQRILADRFFVPYGHTVLHLLGSQ